MAHLPPMRLRACDRGVVCRPVHRQVDTVRLLRATHPPPPSACREICKAAYQKIQDLRAELDAKWATYKEQNALFRVQLQEDRKRRQEEYLKMKAERDAERAGGRGPGGCEARAAGWRAGGRHGRRHPS